MMIFTHVLMGSLLGLFIGTIYPDFLSVALFAGFLGGAFPDFDMLLTHRRTFHFPVGFTIVTVIMGVVVVYWHSLPAIALFSFVLSSSVHSLTDILGGGKEMRPWLEKDQRAVYNHVAKTWISPWRIFYDGSVTDLGLSLVIGVGLLFYIPSRFQTVIALVMALGVLYTVLRRWITRQISEEYRTFSDYFQQKLRSRMGKW